MPIFQAGTLNTTALIVPDVFVQIIPPSQLALNGIPSNMVGLVGSASWGPLNTAINVASMQDFAFNFGNVNNRQYDMATHAAIITIQGGNNMMCVRVSDGTEAAATNVVGTNITFTGKHPGTFGNQVSVTLAPGAKTNTWRAIVAAPGFVPEIYDNIGFTNPVVTATVHPAVASSATVVVNSTAGITSGMAVTGTGISGTVTVSSVTNATTLVLSSPQTIADNTILTFSPSNNEIWVNMAAAINNGTSALRGASNWVVATAGVGAQAPSSQTYNLVGGADGAGVDASDLIGDSAVSSGMYALGGSGIAILDVCDVDDNTQYTTIDAFAASESAYAIQTLPSGTTVSGAQTAKRASGLDSYTSKLMHGDFIYWRDPVNQVVRLVSPQAFVAGRISNLSPEQSTLNKSIAGVAGTQKSGFGTLNSFYSTNDLVTLETNGIDVITNPGGGHLNIWTCRMGHNSSTNITVHVDNYTTLTNYISKTLEGGLGFYLGRPVSLQLFNDITATLTQFLQNLTGNGLLLSPDGTTPYSVLCSIANNPPSQTALGIVQADVQAVYPSINEKFLVNLQGGSTVTVTRVTANR